MAATTLEQVMVGLTDRLQTIPGLNTSAASPSQISVPFAFAGLPAIPEYRATFRRGYFSLVASVTVLVSAALDLQGQLELAAYASVTGEKSIPAAIEGDRTLGGVVDECYVASFDPIGLDEVGAIGYFGGRFEIPIIARGA